MSSDIGAKGNHSLNINRVCLEEDIKIVTNNLVRTKCSSYQKPSPKRKDSSVLVSHKEIRECNNNKRASNARNRLSRKDKHHLQKGRGRKANEENGLTGSPNLQETLIGANMKANQRRRQRSYEFQR
ncbi:hypothetical protein H5410_015106 [Solanum commersonii]|uniref:Uncharacterized protein n=1 Tax=Solanum commersonii TaxID=4109 RepID=A0A9J5ZTD9_SOLCO|nr:hypothetical protein H5410_015106 [Solanum commersonii]